MIINRDEPDTNEDRATFEHKLEQAGYLPDDGTFIKQVGNLLLRWEVLENHDLIVMVYEVRGVIIGNLHVLTLTFYHHYYEPVGRLEAGVLEMYKLISGLDQGGYVSL